MDPSTARSEINYLDHGDGLNLWYVALTRAKKVLSLPPELMALIEDFEYFLKSQRTHQQEDNSSPDLMINSTAKRIKLEVESSSHISETESSEDNCVLMNEERNQTAVEAVHPPRTFLLNGKVPREATQAELQSLSKHLAYPWAKEMLAADGGLIIDDINRLSYFSFESGTGNITGSSTGSIKGYISPYTSGALSPSFVSLPTSSPKYCSAFSPSTATNSFISPLVLQFPTAASSTTSTPRTDNDDSSDKKKSMIGNAFGMCYYCQKKGNHYASTCPNRA